MPALCILVNDNPEGQLTLVGGFQNDFWSGLVDVLQRVLPKTTAPNHSMLRWYPIFIDPRPYLEYTRAYARAYWHVKKRVKIEKSTFEGSKKYHFSENPHGRVLTTVPPSLGYN